MVEPPRVALRRLPPDIAQFQTILGSLLGGAVIRGRPGTRRLVMRHGLGRARYIHWKGERLGALADGVPRRDGDSLVLETIAHPLFDDLVQIRADDLRARLTPLGFAVWLADVGRLELDGPSVLPAQRALALVS